MRKSILALLCGALLFAVPSAELLRVYFVKPSWIVIDLKCYGKLSVKGWPSEAELKRCREVGGLSAAKPQSLMLKGGIEVSSENTQNTDISTAFKQAVGDGKVVLSGTRIHLIPLWSSRLTASAADWRSMQPPSIALDKLMIEVEAVLKRKAFAEIENSRTLLYSPAREENLAQQRPGYAVAMLVTNGGTGTDIFCGVRIVRGSASQTDIQRCISFIRHRKSLVDTWLPLNRSAGVIDDAMRPIAALLDWV